MMLGPYACRWIGVTAPSRKMLQRSRDCLIAWLAVLDISENAYGGSEDEPAGRGRGLHLRDEAARVDHRVHPLECASERLRFRDVAPDELLVHRSRTRVGVP